MNWFLKTAWRGLHHNGAETMAEAPEPWLRGRTYAIPFDRVWQAALELAQGGLPRWSLIDADDYEGVIRVEISEAFLRPATRVTIRIGLGIDAQTRVDATAHAPDRRGDLGMSTRAVALFFSALDRAVAGGAARPRKRARR
jgi:hypothetical protein